MTTTNQTVNLSVTQMDRATLPIEYFEGYMSVTEAGIGMCEEVLVGSALVLTIQRRDTAPLSECESVTIHCFDDVDIEDAFEEARQALTPLASTTLFSVLRKEFRQLGLMQ